MQPAYCTCLRAVLSGRRLNFSRPGSPLLPGALIAPTARLPTGAGGPNRTSSESHCGRRLSGAPGERALKLQFGLARQVNKFFMTPRVPPDRQADRADRAARAPSGNTFLSATSGQLRKARVADPEVEPSGKQFKIRLLSGRAPAGRRPVGSSGQGGRELRPAGLLGAAGKCDRISSGCQGQPF